MANTIDTSLNNELVSSAVLNAFVSEIQPILGFSTNFSAALGSRGDTVHVPYVPAASAAGNFTPGTGYTRQDSTISKRTVELNKHKFVSWRVTDLEQTNSSSISLDLFGQQKGFQLAKAVFQDILSVVTAANFGAAAHTGAAANFDSNDVADIALACDLAEMPSVPRSLVLGSSYYWALAKDSGIKSSDAFGGSEAIREGRIPNVFGFNAYKSNLIPANAQNLVGMAAYPSAVAVAMRYLSPVGSGGDGVYRAVVDPSGVTLGYREYYDNDLGERVAIMEALYGYSLAEAAALKRIVSA